MRKSKTGRAPSPFYHTPQPCRNGGAGAPRTANARPGPRPRGGRVRADKVGRPERRSGEGEFQAGESRDERRETRDESRDRRVETDDRGRSGGFDAPLSYLVSRLSN